MRAEELPERGHEIHDDRPCRYSSGSTSVICGALRAHGGRIADLYRDHNEFCLLKARLNSL